MTGHRLERRQLLASAAVGLAVGGAGCGYQPAAGDLDWTASIDAIATPRDVDWLTDGTLAYAVFRPAAVPLLAEDTSVRAYSNDGSLRWAGGVGPAMAGTPAVADDALFLPLADGTVVRLERDENGDDRAYASSGDDAVTVWTTAWDEPDAPSVADGTDAEKAANGARGPGDGNNTTDRDDPGTDHDAAEERDRDDEPPALELVASDAIVVGHAEEMLVGFDAADGDELFRMVAGEEPLESVASVDGIAVAGDVVWAAVDDGARSSVTAIDRAGAVAAGASVPARVDWLEATVLEDEPLALAGAEDTLVAIDAAGERSFSVPLPSSPRAPNDPILSGGDRLYHATGDSIAAIDLTTGERRWVREDFRFESATADVDGVRATGRPADSDGCELFAIDAAGDDWWSVPLLEDLDCGVELFALGDRLVAASGGDLYGFYPRPGDRLSVL